MKTKLSLILGGVFGGIGLFLPLASYHGKSMSVVEVAKVSGSSALPIILGSVFLSFILVGFFNTRWINLISLLTGGFFVYTLISWHADFEQFRMHKKIGYHFEVIAALLVVFGTLEELFRSSGKKKEN